MDRLAARSGALAGVTCLAAGVLLGTRPLHRPHAPDRCDVAASLQISARVAGAYSALVREVTTVRLEAVILARGRPGWPTARARSYVPDGPPPLPDGRPRPVAGAGFGGLMFAYERDSGVAWVGRRSIHLSPGNLLLLDGVDSAAAVLASVSLPATVQLTRPGCTSAGGAELGDSVDALVVRVPALATFLAP